MTKKASIADAFRIARHRNVAALMPYFTLGYPDPSASLEIIAAIAASGADIIELGIPFSDPLADGPTIQRSTQVALEAGITPADCLEMVAELRRRGLTQPLILMGYFNPILQYGPSSFAADTAEAGADGLIIPDLPLEEEDELDRACRRQGLVLVRMIAPTSPTERIRAAAARSDSFIYLVSLIGVTGARQQLGQDVGQFIRRIRLHTDLPLAVGFGISTIEQARSIGAVAEGVIIGSALIDAVTEADDKLQAASEFIGKMKNALATAEGPF